MERKLTIVEKELFINAYMRRMTGRNLRKIMVEENIVEFLSNRVISDNIDMDTVELDNLVKEVRDRIKPLNERAHDVYSKRQEVIKLMKGIKKLKEDKKIIENKTAECRFDDITDTILNEFEKSKRKYKSYCDYTGFINDYYKFQEEGLEEAIDELEKIIDIEEIDNKFKKDLDYVLTTIESRYPNINIKELLSRLNIKIGLNKNISDHTGSNKNFGKILGCYTYLYTPEEYRKELRKQGLSEDEIALKVMNYEITYDETKGELWIDRNTFYRAMFGEQQRNILLRTMFHEVMHMLHHRYLDNKDFGLNAYMKITDYAKTSYRELWAEVGASLMMNDDKCSKIIQMQVDRILKTVVTK